MQHIFYFFEKFYQIDEDFYNKSIFYDFRNSFDLAYGLDSVYYKIGKYQLACFANNSPLDKRVEQFFGYKPTVYAEKTYKAVWNVEDGLLQILFVNGTINNKRLFTDDFILEYPDDTVFYNYKYTGKLHLSVQQKLVPPVFEKLLSGKTVFTLEFKNGKVVG